MSKRKYKPDNLSANKTDNKLTPNDESKQGAWESMTWMADHFDNPLENFKIE